MNPITIIWAVAAAFAVCTVYAAISQKAYGNFVSALLEIDAVGEANAIDGSRLACPPSRTIEQSIGKNSAFGKTVAMTPEGRYYILPERCNTAKTFYAKEKHLIAKTALMLVAIVILAIAATELLPVFENMVDGLLGDMLNIFGDIVL